MKIAFTGASSTGKTTLVRSIIAKNESQRYFSQFLTADARAILDELGFHSMDDMSRSQLRAFQLSYFYRKQQIEQNQDNFITDRSFVDVAAYWVLRDTFDVPEEQARLVLPCSREASKYDIHFYFPYGLINFEPDGYRSNDIIFHQRIDSQILLLLESWRLPYVRIQTANHEERIKYVLSCLRGM
ncbi:ATP/GTP-binding protein [Sorangium sp. So ce388]|uniref:ATP/GTP-binding protein n=1 Tax=Sorangium sp. So ce388 TaxID=3133309 RepID=UPI003F5BFC17